MFGWLSSKSSQVERRQRQDRLKEIRARRRLYSEIVKRRKVFKDLLRQRRELLVEACRFQDASDAERLLDASDVDTELGHYEWSRYCRARALMSFASWFEVTSRAYRALGECMLWENEHWVVGGRFGTAVKCVDLADGAHQIAESLRYRAVVGSLEGLDD